MLTTTRNKLRRKGVCRDRYDHLCANYPDRKYNDTITLEEILQSNGINDAVWAFQACGRQGRSAATRWLFEVGRKITTPDILKTRPNTAELLESGDASDEALGDAAMGEWRRYDAWGWDWVERFLHGLVVSVYRWGEEEIEKYIWEGIEDVDDVFYPQEILDVMHRVYLEVVS